MLDDSLVEQDFNKIRLVYMGRRINKKNKLVHLYAEEGNLNSQIYLKNKIGDFGIGAVVEVFDYGDYFKPPYIGVGKWQDATLVASWNVEDSLSYCQHKSQQNWKKLEDKNSGYDQLVMQINELIACLPASQKKPFLFKLLADIDFKL